MKYELNKIYNMDCLEFMRDVPDNYFDLVLTDPPYGIGDRSGFVSKNRQYKNNYTMFDDNEEYIDSVVVQAIHECIRISKAVIVTPGPKWFTKYPQPDDIGFFYQPATCSLSKWGRADSQPIFYYGKDPNAGKSIQFNSYKLTEIPEKNGHPCPKPIKAWEWLLRKGIGNLNVKVFDPFMGSGTTAVACKSLGIDFVGCELEPDYVAIANKRLEAVQGSLF